MQHSSQQDTPPSNEAMPPRHGVIPSRLHAFSYRTLLQDDTGHWDPSRLLLLLTALWAVPLLLYRAMSGIDVAWDTFGYHLPFAARAAGLCGVECFEMLPHLETRFVGFPKLAHMLQGGLWRLTGTPAVGDLLNLFGMAALVVTARYVLRVSVPLLLVSLLCIPLVRIHLTTSYIDLFCNCMVACSFVLLFHAFMQRAARPWPLLLPLLPLVCTANSKYQMLPITLGVVILVLVLFLMRLRDVTWKSRGLFLVGFLLLSTTIFAWNLSNLARFGNPFYPIHVEVAGVTFQGDEPTVSDVSLSRHWQETPGMLVWMASVLEMHAYDARPVPWTEDQGSVDASQRSFRMGGYFVPYVLACMVLLVCTLANTPARIRLVLLGFFLCLTCGTMLLPANHELRYYMYWMLALVLLPLTLCSRSDIVLSQERRLQHAKMMRWVVLIAFYSTLSLTGGRYLQPSPSMQQVLDTFNATAVAATQLRDGQVHCMASATHAPFVFLHSSLFFAGRDYSLVEMVNDSQRARCDVLIE